MLVVPVGRHQVTPQVLFVRKALLTTLLGTTARINVTKSAQIYHLQLLNDLPFRHEPSGASLRRKHTRVHTI